MVAGKRHNNMFIIISAASNKLINCHWYFNYFYQNCKQHCNYKYFVKYQNVKCLCGCSCAIMHFTERKHGLRNLTDRNFVDETNCNG